MTREIVFLFCFVSKSRQFSLSGLPIAHKGEKTWCIHMNIFKIT